MGREGCICFGGRVWRDVVFRCSLRGTFFKEQGISLIGGEVVLEESFGGAGGLVDDLWQDGFPFLSSRELGAVVVEVLVQGTLCEL